MPQLGTYTQRNYTDFDGTELVPLVDGGTMYKTTVAEVSKYIQQNYSAKPVSQGNITASPTSLPVTAGARNVFWVNTSGGSINISSLSTSLGLLPGQTVIFRKTTADANHVLWTSTTGGSGQTKTLTLRLNKHYANEPKEIELVWDGAAYTPISTWHDPVYGLDITGATSSATAFGQMLTDYSGRTIQLPAGTITLTPADANGWTIPANTKLIGHPDGTTINFKTPTASANQKWFVLSSGVVLEDLALTWDTSTKPTAGFSGYMIYAASLSGDTETTGISGIRMRRVTVSGCGQAQDYILSNHYCMLLIGVSRSIFEDCDFRWSLGSGWGVEIVGGSNCTFDNCRFYENSADGLKYHAADTYSNGNTLYTTLKNLRCVNCLFYRNGWQVLTGETVYTATYTAAASPGSVVNGGRYLLNFTGAAGNFTLPNANNGDVITIHRKVGSAYVPTITHAGGLINGDGFGNFPSNTLPITEYHASEGRDLIRTGIRATFSTSTNQWTVTTGLNGEGVDGSGENVVFDNCAFYGNQGAGGQVKPNNYSSVACRFTNCASYDNWGTGFLVHNAHSGSTVAGPTSITFTNCTASGNYEAGFSTTALLHVGCMLFGCVARSNRGYGYSFQRQMREFQMVGCQARGNGKGYNTLTGGYAWNVAISQGRRVKLIGCTLSGVDAVDQGLDIDSELDNVSNTRCYGLYVLRDSGSQEADNNEIVGCTFHNHQSSLDIGYYHTGSTSGSLNNYGETQLWYPQKPVSGESFLTVGTSSVSVPFTRPGYTASRVGIATAASNGPPVTLTDSNATFPTAAVPNATSSAAVGLEGYVVRITGGTGAGQWRLISSNTATVLTLSTSWTTVPDTTSTYEVIGLQVTLPYTPLARDIVITPTSPLQTATAWQIRNITTTGFDLVTYNSSGAKTAISAGVTGTATAQSTTSLTDTAKTWSDDEWNGFLIRITGGVTTPNGAGQYRTITDTVGGGTDRVDVATWVNPGAGTSTYVIGDWAFGYKVQRG